MSQFGTAGLRDAIRDTIVVARAAWRLRRGAIPERHDVGPLEASLRSYRVRLSQPMPLGRGKWGAH